MAVQSGATVQSGVAVQSGATVQSGVAVQSEPESAGAQWAHFRRSTSSAGLPCGV